MHMDISGGHLGGFTSQYETINNVSSITNKVDIAIRDFEFHVTADLCHRGKEGTPLLDL